MSVGILFAFVIGSVLRWDTVAWTCSLCAGDTAIKLIYFKLFDWCDFVLLHLHHSVLEHCHLLPARLANLVTQQKTFQGSRQFSAMAKVKWEEHTCTDSGHNHRCHRRICPRKVSQCQSTGKRQRSTDVKKGALHTSRTIAIVDRACATDYTTSERDRCNYILYGWNFSRVRYLFYLNQIIKLKTIRLTHACLCR